MILIQIQKSYNQLILYKQFENYKKGKKIVIFTPNKITILLKIYYQSEKIDVFIFILNFLNFEDIDKKFLILKEIKHFLLDKRKNPFMKHFSVDSIMIINL